MLIDVPGKISKVYETLGDLFDKISVFLSQFKIYKRISQDSNIDLALKSTIHELLICFVDICSLSYKVLKGGKFEKFKVAMKAGFCDDDSGVSAQLATLDRLVRKESAVVETLTLESVLKNENQLAELHESWGITDQRSTASQRT